MSHRFVHIHLGKFKMSKCDLGIYMYWSHSLVFNSTACVISHVAVCLFDLILYGSWYPPKSDNV